MPGKSGQAFWKRGLLKRALKGRHHLNWRRGRECMLYGRGEDRAWKKPSAPMTPASEKGNERMRRTRWEGIRELVCPWKSLKNPSWNRKPLKGTQVTAQHSLVDMLMEMTSPTAIWAQKCLIEKNYWIDLCWYAEEFLSLHFLKY